MDKKSTRILLSILHICILGVCILTISMSLTAALGFFILLRKTPNDGGSSGGAGHGGRNDGD